MCGNNASDFYAVKQCAWPDRVGCMQCGGFSPKCGPKDFSAEIHYLSTLFPAEVLLDPQHQVISQGTGLPTDAR